MKTQTFIHCYKCANEFPIDCKSNLTEIVCPNCQTKMNDDMVKYVIDLWNRVAETNGEFVKYNQERNEPLFGVNFHQVKYEN